MGMDINRSRRVFLFGAIGRFVFVKLLAAAPDPDYFRLYRFSNWKRAALVVIAR